MHRERAMSIETLTGNAVAETAFDVPGPLALDFYQSTCPPCLALEPRLESGTCGREVRWSAKGRVPAAGYPFPMPCR